MNWEPNIMLYIQKIIFLFSVLLFGTLTLNSAPAAAQERRVALVIGVSEYEQIEDLPNATRDATLVAKALRQAKFEVTEALDPTDIASMGRALREFRQKATTADAAVVYYAGHGVGVGGQNWLLPSTVDLQTVADLEFQSLRADQLVEAVAGASKVRLVILDACRNNPFNRARGFRPGIRSVGGNGLARVDANAAVVVLMAAAPGQSANDGDGMGNSPFALALAKFIQTPGGTLGELPTKLVSEVSALTQGSQRPDQSGIIEASSWQFVSQGAEAIASLDRPQDTIAPKTGNVRRAAVDAKSSLTSRQLPKREVKRGQADKNQNASDSSKTNWLRAEARTAGYLRSGRSLRNGARDAGLVIGNGLDQVFVYDSRGGIFSAIETDTPRTITQNNQDQFLKYVKSDASASVCLAAAPPSRVVYFQCSGGNDVILYGHRAQIVAFGFTNNDNIIYTASIDGEIRLWSTSDASEYFFTRLESCDLTDLAFSANGRTVAATCGREKFFLGRIETKKGIVTVTWTTQVNNAKLGGERVSIDANGEVVLIYGTANSVYAWKPASNEVTSLTGVNTSDLKDFDYAEISADGKHAFGIDESGNIIFWDLKSGAKLELARMVCCGPISFPEWRVGPGPDHEDLIDFSPDGKFVSILNPGTNTLYLFDRVQLRIESTFNCNCVSARFEQNSRSIIALPNMSQAVVRISE